MVFLGNPRWKMVLFVLVWVTFGKNQARKIKYEAGDPEVTLSGRTLTMEETTKPFTTLLKGKKYDGKSSVTVTITSGPFVEYKISTKKDYFLIILNQAIDYESLGNQPIAFKVSVGADCATFNLCVKNKDDNSPRLQPTKCSFLENKLYTVENSDCIIEIEDVDGFMNQMKFSFEPDTGLFEVVKMSKDNNDGKFKLITKRGALDFESNILHILKATVEDSGGNRNSGTLIVLVEDDPEDTD